MGSAEAGLRQDSSEIPVSIADATAQEIKRMARPQFTDSMPHCEKLLAYSFACLDRDQLFKNFETFPAHLSHGFNKNQIRLR